MSIFSSDRERRLWRWTLAVVAAIYSTLFLSRIFAGLQMSDDVAAVFFLCAMLMAAVTVATQGLKTKPSTAEIVVVMGVTTVYFMVILRMALTSERSHLIEYSVLAVFIYEALTERAAQGRRVPVPALLAMLLTSVIGLLDELLQLLIPSRVFDPVDIFFNVMAAVLAVSASVSLKWVRKRFKKGNSRQQS